MPSPIKVKNRGINWEKERAEQDGTEHKFGATSALTLYALPQDRLQYLPNGEVQFNTRADFQDCATRSPDNGWESVFNYAYPGLLKPENAKWLEDNGYIENGKVVFADRFNAVLSGTTHDGNSLKAPIHSTHRDGLIPKRMLPVRPDMTWDEYHDKGAITQEMIDTGREFVRRFQLMYDQVQVAQFEYTLKLGEVVCAGGFAWPTPENGIYGRVDYSPNHAFLVFGLPKFLAFDSYVDPVDGDFVKQLAPEYNFYPYGYRLYVASEHTPEETTVQNQVLLTLSRFGLLSFFADWLDRFTRSLTGIWRR